MSKRIYITGIGIICAIGNNTAETLESLLEGKSGIGAITLLKTIHQGKLPMAEVKKTNDELIEILALDRKSNYTRTTLLGMMAAREALKSSGISDLKKFPTGLISATTVGGMDRSEHFFEDFLIHQQKGRLKDIIHHDCGDSTESIADDLGISAFVTTISTACSSSANAMMLGAQLIRNGILDRVVVGGTDAVTRFTLNGFNTLMILDKNGCRPFDENRAGLTIGEGAAFLVLESEKTAFSPEKKIFGELSGYGNANDAYHQTASSPEGTGARLAMEKALSMSGLMPDQISYINVHGTGTQNNDLSEGFAIEKVFGDKVPLFSSTKSYTGHTLGAAGAIEAVISLLSIQHDCIFPNLNWSTPMKELNLSPVTELKKGISINTVLSNSFGFGGNNSAIILSKFGNSEMQKFNSTGLNQVYTEPRIEGVLSLPVYINGLGLISPQKTLDNKHFLEDIVAVESDFIKCQEPVYKDYVSGDMVRRMSRLIKMGVAASKICLQDAGCSLPDAIITGTGLGCIEDTEKFLTTMIRNKEELLTPTSFIQSTHNTVSAQIALLLKCHHYNFTYCHRGFSFETALIDAITKIGQGNASEILAGGMDELTENSFRITYRLGHWKRKPGLSTNLLHTPTSGSLAGEGAAFFLLGSKKTEKSYAILNGLSLIYKPLDHEEILDQLKRFLTAHGIGLPDIDLWILGKNGDPRDDRPYQYLMDHLPENSSMAAFKHLSGEYQTAGGFGLWLASMVIKHDHVPEMISIRGDHRNPIRKVLLYNHYRNLEHSFTLLSQA